MQYETIILELLSRIKVLEDEVTAIKQTLNTTEAANSNPEIQSDRASSTYQKMSDEMILACYECGKRLHNGENLASLVKSVMDETDMNRNSAIMYLYAVSAMLEGTIYKRAISTKATKMYFDQILNEYGKHGLKNALKSANLHINYRKEFGHTVDSIEELYKQYLSRL